MAGCGVLSDSSTESDEEPRNRGKSNWPVPELDDWIRRRVRMYYWKQWRWVRTKIKNLLTLGVSLKTAIQHRVSSKSY